MRVHLIFRLYGEEIGFCQYLFLMAPVVHIIQEVKHAHAKAWKGQVGGNGFPGSAKKMVRGKKFFVLIFIGITGAAFCARVGRKLPAA